MAVLNSTSLAGPGVRAVTELTLTASDTFTYDPGRPNGLLYLRNPTAGALSPTITGSTASAAILVSGYGNVSAAAGYPLGSIAAGGARVIPLDTIRLYLEGNITITGGTGLVASFLQY